MSEYHKIVSLKCCSGKIEPKLISVPQSTVLYVELHSVKFQHRVNDNWASKFLSSHPFTSGKTEQVEFVETKRKRKTGTENGKRKTKMEMGKENTSMVFTFLVGYYMLGRGFHSCTTHPSLAGMHGLLQH